MRFIDEDFLEIKRSDDEAAARESADQAVEATLPALFIGVVAEITGTHPQTLRNYERIGLLRPGRSQGDVRMYSRRDVDRVRRIRRLTQELGVNLAGVEVILNLIEKLESLQHHYEDEIREAERRHREEAGRLKAMLRRVTG